MTVYDRTIGRLRVIVNDNGASDHGYSHGCFIQCRDGWNDDSRMLTHTVSVEELRDLRYLIDRAIAAAERPIHYISTTKELTPEQVAEIKSLWKEMYRAK